MLAKLSVEPATVTSRICLVHVNCIRMRDKDQALCMKSAGVARMPSQLPRARERDVD